MPSNKLFLLNASNQMKKFHEFCDSFLALNLLHRNLALKSGKLVELCERNTHTMEFLILMAKLKKDNPTEDDQMDALESKWSDDEM